MIDGPYKSNRWLERISNLEGLLLVLFSIGSLVYLGILGYEFFVSGHILKFVGLLVVGLVLTGLAIRSSSFLGLLALLLFVFAVGVWK
jgi:hypothetical protein